MKWDKGIYERQRRLIILPKRIRIHLACVVSLCEQHDNTPMCHKSYQGSQVTDERDVTCYTLLLSQIQIKYDIILQTIPSTNTH